MKMFVWANPYPVSYGGSRLTVVASSLAAAKKLAASKAARTFSFTEFEEENKNGIQLELGEPTRIVDLPCAEWDEWSE